MGGRNEYDLGLDKEENRKFREVGMIDGIKILKVKEEFSGRTPTPTYSNTPNAQYVILDSSNNIENFYFFDGHHLVRSVDFNNEDGPHAHNWTMVDSPKGKTPGRKSHSKKNNLPLSAEEWNMYEKIKNFIKTL